MALIGNVIWFVLAGWSLGLSWLLAALICCVSIVLIPYAPSCVRLGLLSAFPFGNEAVDRRVLENSETDATTQTVRGGLNLIWLLLVGWWLALYHVICGVALCLTLIGIPFGIQAFKIAGAVLWPVGKEVVAEGAARYAEATFRGGGRG